MNERELALFAAEQERDDWQETAQIHTLTINSLVQENERLRDLVEVLRTDLVELAKTFNAENERLREALKRIRNGKDHAPWSLDEGWAHRLKRKEMQVVAGDALEEKP